MRFNLEQAFSRLRRWLKLRRLNSSGIDLVYTWVDGDDPAFQRELKRHAGEEDAQDVSKSGARRFRSNDELRYSLRSVETYAPWVDRIFLVTNGQVPRWLKRDHSRLRLIHHREIFSDSEHLPTFNSAAIETHLHHIPDLSRQFLFLNDDVFFGNTVQPETFLNPSGQTNIWIDPWPLPSSRTKGDLPSRWLAYNRQLLCEVFGEREFFCIAHAPILFDRNVLAEIKTTWQSEFERTSAQRFRTHEMALIHVLYTYFLAAQKKCELVVFPADYRPFVQFQPPLENILKALERINRTRPPYFCINDDWDLDGETKHRILNEFLESYFPTASSFEQKT